MTDTIPLARKEQYMTTKLGQALADLEYEAECHDAKAQDLLTIGRRCPGCGKLLGADGEQADFHKRKAETIRWAAAALEKQETHV